MSEDREISPIEAIEIKISVAASEIRDIIEQLEQDIGYPIHIQALPLQGDEIRKYVRLTIVVGSNYYYSKNSWERNWKE